MPLCNDEQFRRDDHAHLWAYLADQTPTEGPQRLIEQKRVVDRIAALERRTIGRYVVDSGSALRRGGRGANLDAMIADLRSSGLKITLVVASLGDLGATRRIVMGALADLLAVGVVMKDASGELHPDPATVALAVAAARRLPAGSKRLVDRDHA